MIAQRSARERLAWIALGACALGALGISIAREFGRPEDMAGPTFGTAWAPYSDALGPWTYGALSILFGLQPPDYLYRPTIGYFWASILAVAGRLEAIPISFAAWLVAFFGAALVLAGEPRLRNALVLALALVALSFDTTWARVYLSSANVDLPALAFTGTGLVLLIWGRGGAALPALLAGCLCLGIAAAVRGPMMLAGAVMIAIRLAFPARATLRTVVLAIAMFLLPIAIEAGLERLIGATHSGLLGMYCFRWDATHTWTPACSESFLQRKAGVTEVVVDYLDYVFSSEGFERVRTGLYRRVATDLAALAQWPTLAALFTAGVLARNAKAAGKYAWLRSPPALGAFAAGLILLTRAVEGWPPWLALSVVLIATTLAARLRAWDAVLCLAGYLSATVFLALLGLTLAPYDRLQQTFSIALYLGLAVLVMDGSEPLASPPPGYAIRRWALPAAVFAAVALLALGHLGPSRWRDAYVRDVAGREGRALKISEDSRIDRSLYFSGRGDIFYVRSDGLPVGTVRSYRGLASQRTANESFRDPNAFVE